VKEQVARRLDFLDYADKHYISALHGSGVGVMYESVEACYESAMAKWPTNRLTAILQDATAQHQPPLVQGRRIKLRYAHQGGSNPPVIVVHGNQVDSLPGSYKRYLENTFRKVLNVTGSPIRFEFRSGENPYAHKVDRLSGDILPAIVDDHNHFIDSIRYALQPLIRARSAPRLRRL
jgi:GTP-binding protein